MKVIISETFSCSRKDFETLPENFSIKLEFIKVEVMAFLKVMFYDEDDEELFYSTVAVSPEFTEVAESIRITPCYNIVLHSMLEKITDDFQAVLTSSAGSIAVFDLDKLHDSWYGHLNEQLEDYCKKHFK